MQDKISYTVNFVEDITGLNEVGKYFATMIAIDAFFLNEDRHTNNIAVLRNEKTKKYRLAPIFDNGLSLLSDTNGYPFDKDVYDNISTVKAKPFDINFDEQLNAAEELYGTHLKFHFTKKIKTITELCDAGYEDNILLSHDALFFNGFNSKPVINEKPRFSYCFDNILPNLSEQFAEKAMIKNPIKMLKCDE